MTRLLLLKRGKDDEAGADDEMTRGENGFKPMQEWLDGRLYIIPKLYYDTCTYVLASEVGAYDEAVSDVCT
jgi:hypothetical protein